LRRVINLAPSPLTPDSKTISFIGQLQPGDVLVIDLKAMNAYLNGTNVLDKISGDFFELLAGTNELQYSDASASRNLGMKIEKRTKYL
jgi:phage-related protein